MQAVLQDDLSYLSCLVRFGLVPVALQIDPVGHISSAEDVVTSVYPFAEPQTPGQDGQVLETGIRDGLTETDRIPAFAGMTGEAARGGEVSGSGFAPEAFQAAPQFVGDGGVFLADGFVHQHRGLAGVPV